MRLIHIDNPNKCSHISDIMPSIKAIYQLEQEFKPYLNILFVSNKNPKQNQKIILQTKNENIHREFTFKNKYEIQILRDLIWENLVKEQKIIDITEPKNFNKRGTFKVYDSYKKSKENRQNYNYTPIKVETYTKQTKINPTHQIFNLRDNTLNYNQCMKQYDQLCKNNYRQDTYEICKLENERYCKKYL
jgi:hypothetical protein